MSRGKSFWLEFIHACLSSLTPPGPVSPCALAGSADSSSCRLEFQGILQPCGKLLARKGLGMLTACDKSCLGENQHGSGWKPEWCHYGNKITHLKIKCALEATSCTQGIQGGSSYFLYVYIFLFMYFLIFSQLAEFLPCYQLLMQM